MRFLHFLLKQPNMKNWRMRSPAPGACALFGLPGSGRAMVYAALAKETGRFLCIVTPGEAEATRFAGDLNALGIPTAVFPARDYVLRPIEGTAREYEYRRLSVLGRHRGWAAAGRLCAGRGADPVYHAPHRVL